MALVNSCSFNAPFFEFSQTEQKDLEEMTDSKQYIGRSKEQVEEFLKEYVYPVLEKNKNLLGIKAEINV